MFKKSSLTVIIILSYIINSTQLGYAHSHLRPMSAANSEEIERQKLIGQFYDMAFRNAGLNYDRFVNSLSRQLGREPEDIKRKAQEVLEVMRKIPRHHFMKLESEEIWKVYCLDLPESIGYGQTISAEHMVLSIAAMLDLKETDEVLEIGTGSGRQAAIMSEFCKEVHTFERIKELREFGSKNLTGFGNVYTYYDDGTIAIPDKKFDKIIITAASKYKVVEELAGHLKDGGIILAPVIKPDSRIQMLTICKKEGGQLKKKELFRVDFVPLLKGKFEGTHENRKQLNMDELIQDLADNIQKIAEEEKTIDTSMVETVLKRKVPVVYITPIAARWALDQLTKGKNPLLEHIEPGVSIYRIIQGKGKAGQKGTLLSPEKQYLIDKMINMAA